VEVNHFGGIQVISASDAVRFLPFFSENHLNDFYKFDPGTLLWFS